MSKFFKKLIIFVIPIIIILSIFEYNLSRIPTSYNLKKNFLDKNASSIQILALGSSHALSGVNPEFFSMKGFNAADSSQSLYYDYQIYKKYADDLKNLKVVIVPISYFSLEYNFSRNTEAWRENFYKKIYGFGLETKKSNIDIRGFSYMALYGQLRSIFYASKLFKVNLAANINENGWYKQEGKEAVWEFAQKRAQYHESIMDPMSLDNNVNYLKKMIESIKIKGADVMLITVPVTTDYSNNVNLEKYNLMQDTIRKITEEYDIKYFNYFSDKRFVSDDFYSSDHLNAAGAEKFSKILDIDIKNANKI
ncbi:MAG: hypothetical protein CEN87_220 [Parcubacteria group bacterium Licking1014_1]|nr:MAG: hypothetical protein CEN87_220 [Parcubacteria group bacterium Licking1014_1]